MRRAGNFAEKRKLLKSNLLKFQQFKTVLTPQKKIAEAGIVFFLPKLALKLRYIGVEKKSHYLSQ